MRRTLLATPARWAAGSALAAALAWPLARALGGPLGARDAVLWAGGAAALASGALFLYLRGEEARLCRELRVARSGTSVQRRTLLRRRRPSPYFGLAMFWYAAVRVLAALASTTLGYAAVLLAEGDVDVADATLRGFGQALSFGDLRALRSVVAADLLRARGGEVALGEAIRAMVAIPPMAHVEAERYRVHVLVKALLEQADDATARALAEDLKARADDDVRVYLVWLATWFDWTHLDAPGDAEMRRALLLARAHGAVDLVGRLESQLAARVAAATYGATDSTDSTDDVPSLS